MNKQEFKQILNAALLYYEGMSEQTLVDLGLRQVAIDRGIKICEYLKSQEEEEVWKSK